MSNPLKWNLDQTINLPLTVAVGNAIADYLSEERPDAEEDILFLRSLAPFVPLTDHASCHAVVSRVFKLAGIKKGDRILGMHMLRHHAASAMVKNEVPIETIAAILGHSSPDATDIYITTDEIRLRECVLPMSGISKTLMSHLLVWGNAYAQIIRDGNGRVLSLYPLLPDKMDVDRDDKGRLYYIYTRNSDENPNFNEYGRVYLQEQDVLHIPGLGFDGLVGYSPIAMAKNAVGMTLACEEYGASFFENGATPGGVLEHPGVLKDPAKVRESWHSVYGGSRNAEKVAVLEEGMKYQQIGIPPEEAQFLETRKFQINEIARLYRIPPHMVGDLDKSSFSNIEQQSLEFVKYTLDPWVIRWEQSLQKSLFLPMEKQEYFIN